MPAPINNAGFNIVFSSLTCAREVRGERVPVEPFALAASSISTRRREMRTSEITVLPAAHTGIGADASWGIVKARTEEPVKVRNIGKAGLQCDVANLYIEQVLRRQELERMFQP